MDPNWEAYDVCWSYYIGQSSKAGCLYDTLCCRKGKTLTATKSDEFQMRCTLQTTPKLLLECSQEVGCSDMV